MDIAIQKVYRQTGLVLTKPLILCFAGVILPWYFILKYNLTGIFFTVLLIWTLVVFVHIFKEVIVWYKTAFMVSSHNIIYNKSTGIFSGSSIESELDQIVSIKHHTPNSSAKIFDYGDLEITLTGANEPIIVKNIINPSVVKAEVWQMVKNFRKDTQQLNNVL